MKKKKCPFFFISKNEKKVIPFKKNFITKWPTESAKMNEKRKGIKFILNKPEVTKRKTVLMEAI